MIIEKLKSADTWLGAFVAGIIAAALYLMQAATGVAPEPPELVEDMVETLSTDIFGETTPADDLVEGSADEGSADEGSGSE